MGGATRSETAIRCDRQPHWNQRNGPDPEDGFAGFADANPAGRRAREQRKGGFGSFILHQRRTRSHQIEHGRFRSGHRRPSAQMKWRPVLIALLAFVGMIDALYLSIKRNAGPIPCHVTRGCTDVLTSKYSAIGPIPLSWIGLAFYITILSFAVF